jgi:hypothetical protein
MSYPPGPDGYRTPTIHGNGPNPRNNDWAPPRRDRANPFAWVALGLAVIALGVGGWFAYDAYTEDDTAGTAAPAAAGRPAAAPAAPAAKTDSGVGLCKEMRDNPAVNSEKLNQRRYADWRGKFAGSRDKALREHGVKMMDLAWKIGKNPDSASEYTFQLIEAATGLRTACAAHGVVLPDN